MTATYLILIAIVLFIVYVIIQKLKSYRFGSENIICITGTSGTNKTYLSVALAIKAYKKVHRQWRIDKIKYRLFGFILKRFRDFNDDEPFLYSNIPVLIQSKFLWRKEKWSCKLTREHLLLIQKINKRSIILIDEFSEFANQYSYDNVLVQTKFQELVRFVRHYGQEWRIYTNDQSIDFIAKAFRGRISTNLILYNLRKFPFGFFKVKVNEVVLNAPPRFDDPGYFIFGRYKKHKFYDSHCYSENYSPVLHKLEFWSDYKVYGEDIVRLPKVEFLQQYYKKYNRLPNNWKDYLS